MKVYELVRYLLGVNQQADVRLWNWFALKGTGAEFNLHPTINEDAGMGGVVRLSAEGGRVPELGPQRELYLRVEDSGQFDIVGDTWMDVEEADTANHWCNYYGDVFVKACEYESWTRRKGIARVLPPEYREEEGGEENE